MSVAGGLDIRIRLGIDWAFSNGCDETFVPRRSNLLNLALLRFK